VTAIRGIAKVIALCYQRIDPAERHTDTSTGYTSTVVVTLKNSGRLVISEHASDGLRTKTSGTIADPNKATAVHIGVFADASLQTPLSGVELDAELSSSDQTPLRTFWVKTSYDQVNTAPNGAVTMLVPGQPDQRFVDATKADQIAGQTITQSAALLSVRGGDPAPQLPRPAFSH